MINERYIRQVKLPQVGEKGQTKLAQAKVLVVGAGGLGNALLPYLASAGVGKLGIVDGDTVALSNLHRQVLFNEQDIGQKKSTVLTTKISQQFPDAIVEDYPFFLHLDNAKELLSHYDLILDATDDNDSRYLIDDKCFELGKPFVHASIYRFQFQVAVFNVTGSGTYRCLYPQQAALKQNCSDAGVMPTTVALAGLYQANEALKYVLGCGELLTNKVLLVDTLSLKHSFFSYTKSTEQTRNNQRVIPLKSLVEVSEGAVLLDVRNKEEQPMIRAENCIQIPLKQLSKHLPSLSNKEIAVFCQTGKRSKEAFEILRSNGYNQAYCLREQANDIYNYLKNGKTKKET